MKIIYFLALTAAVYGAELRKYPGASSYGKRCEKDHECSLYLFCSMPEPDGGRSCGCREDKVWSALSTACVTKECSSRHTYSYENPETNKDNSCTLKIGAHGNSEGFRLQEIQDFILACPPSSSFVQNQDGTRAYCQCSEGLGPNRAKTECLTKRSHEQTCQESGEKDVCDPDILGIVCQNGRCECGEPDGHWNDLEHRCYNQAYCASLQNGWGIFYDAETKQCLGEISVFMTVDAFGRGLRCPLHSSPVHHNHRNFPEGLLTCECDKSFAKAENKRACLPTNGFGEACNTHAGNMCDAEKKLFCFAGTCGCLYTDAWDNEQGWCRPKAIA